MTSKTYGCTVSTLSALTAILIFSVVCLSACAMCNTGTVDVAASVNPVTGVTQATTTDGSK